MAKIPRRYWDSSCFLAWLKPEKQRHDACRDVLKAAERQQVQIVTSAISLTEVIKLHKGPVEIPKTAEKAITDFFKQEFIIVVQLTRFIAENARSLIWQFPALRPKDAIHVATAIYAEISDLDTFDKDFLPLNGKITGFGLRISEPKMDQPSLPLTPPPLEEEAPEEETLEPEIN